MMLFAGLVARWGFGLALSSLPAAIVWTSATGVVFLLLLTLLQLHAGGARTAGFLVNLVTLPLLMVGGSFFPFESMPEWMARIGQRTPNGWALVQLKAILAGTLTTPALAARLLVLALLGSVLFVLTLRRLAGRFAREA
jgi:ABC-type multidrug transport system permease subunit